MTLHDAIVATLKTHGHPMTAEEIARHINAHGLYTRGDGELVPSNQVQARIHQAQYRDMFTIDTSSKPQRYALRSKESQPVGILERALAIAERLDELRKRMMRPGQASDPLLATAVGALGARLIEAHASIRLLAREGLAADAGTVLRAMIEGVVRLRWIIKQGSREAQRYLASSIKARESLINLFIRNAKARRERQDLEKKKQQWKQSLDFLGLDPNLLKEAGPSTSIDVRKIAPKVDLPLSVEQYAVFSWDAHCSAIGLERYVMPPSGSSAVVTFNLSRDYEEAGRRLLLANIYYLDVLMILNERFGLGLDEELAALVTLIQEPQD